MRKILTILVIMELIFFTITAFNLTPSVKAQPEPEVYIEPISYEAEELGELFNITVKIRNVTTAHRMVSAEFRLQYNKTIIEPLTVFEGAFMSQFNNTAAEPYTYFTYFFEDELTDPRYGPDVLVGTLIWPNATGVWTNFPEGNGTLAVITFKSVSQIWKTLSTELILNNTKLWNDNGDQIPHTAVHGYYEIPGKPISITYHPSKPSVGEVVVFNAPEYTYSFNVVTYAWDFGDGTSLNVTHPTAHHVYAMPKDYNVTLICTTDAASTNITVEISVSVYTPAEITIDVGSIHFAGEIADFYVLITHFGKPINATDMKATMFHNGSLFADLTNFAQHISTGLYRIPYGIPGTAAPGTYTLVVEVKYYSAEGTNLKSFLVSSTLSGFITAITQGIATVSNDLTEIKMNLTEINAKLVDIQGRIGIINSTLGTLRTDIANLDATLTSLIVGTENNILANVATSLNSVMVELDSINGTIVEIIDGNTATIITSLGEVETKLGDTQSIATTTLYVTSILSAIAIILAIIILMLLRK